MKGDRIGSRLIWAASLAFGLTAAPASATRGIVYDDFPQAVTACSVGASCSGNSLGDLQHFSPVPFSQMYVYRQGIISFDAELPTDPADFGTVTYFAPGYSPSANYDVGLVETNSYSDSWGFVVNFFAAGTSDLAFQAVFIPVNGGENTLVDFIHPTDPLPGALIAYNAFGASNAVYNANGLDFDASAFGVTLNGYFGEENTATDRFSIVRQAGAPAVPEPAEWALMVLGFGLAGAALRETGRRRTATA